MQHEFLMHAILMISASHLYTVTADPSTKAAYREIESLHSTHASSGLRAALSAVTANNASAVFAASILLYIQAWKCDFKPPSDENNHATCSAIGHPIGPDERAMFFDFMVPLGAGIRQMLFEHETYEFMSNSPIFMTLALWSPRADLVRCAEEKGDPALMEEFSVHLDQVFARRHGHLDTFAICEVEFERLKPAYLILHMQKQGLISLDDDPQLDFAMARYLFSWPILLSQDFVTLAKERDTCVKIVMFYYFSAIGRAMDAKNGQVRERYWWAKDRIQFGLPTMGKKLRSEGIEALDLVCMQTCIDQMAEIETIKLD
jgi:hypothetical protein